MVLLTALALLLAVPTASRAQVVRGVVVDDGTGEPIASVQVQLLDTDEAELRRTPTDEQGRFTILAPEPGSYLLRVSRLGYATTLSDTLRIASVDEALEVTLRLGVEAIALDGLTVEGRSSVVHEPSYDGLYARIPRETAEVGGNRIIVKGDWELELGLSAREILERMFPRVWARQSGLCVYWNGFLVHSQAMEARLQTHVNDIEAMEVYVDYLRAPMSMWGPPPDPLATTCSAVVALWALRPDLPGREPR